MTTSHTPGRLHVAGQDRVQIRSDKHQIAKAWSFAGKTGQENARRLVACWNAFDGVPTDDIEKLDARGLALVGGFIEQLSTQRDELMTAMEGLLAYFESGKSVAIGKAIIKTDSVEVRAAYAAIAKVQGGQV